MNIEKKTYSVSVKATRNYQSVSVSEGFDVMIDDKFNQFDFEQEKQRLKDRLVDEARTLIGGFVEQIQIDEDINL